MFNLLFYDLFLWNMFSVIGAVLIVCGLYMVLWGKNKEMKTATHLVSLDNTKEFGVITDVVVVSTTENSDRENNSHDNCKSNIVTN